MNRQSACRGGAAPSLSARPSALAAIALAATPLPALAEEAPAEEARADDLIVTGRQAERLATPDIVLRAATDAQTLANTNMLTTEDAFRYLPNVQVRQRFIGDTLSSLAIRGTNGFQTARVLVTLDGMPISNFLGNTYAFSPLWGLVAPDEIDRVELMAGPYSARYGGNTLGAGVFITTRMPTKFEAGADITYGRQDFDAYDTSLGLDTVRAQGMIGDRKGAVSWSLYADHLESQGQPNYFTVLPVAQGTSPAAGTAVTGALAETDATGTARYVIGSSGATKTNSDLVKAKLAWDANADTRLMLTAAYRDLRYHSLAPETYLSDAAGTPVLSGTAAIDGRDYALSSLLGFRQQKMRLQDLLVGASLTSDLTDRLKGEFSASTYNVLSGETRQAYPAGNGAQVIDTDNQGWVNAAARFGWTPPGVTEGSDGSLGFGADYARYWTGTTTYNSDDWRNGAKSRFAEYATGKTETYGLYVEGHWAMTPALHLTTGLRYDHWRAFDGARRTTALALAYPQRKADGWSPKAVLRWTPATDWAVQFQAARAYRFPTVGELFQSSTSGGVLVQSDPNLKAERGTSLDLGLSRDLSVAGGTLHLGANLFQERVRNALYSQQNSYTGATYYQNIGLVRTRGLELTLGARGLFDGLLDLDGSVTRQKSRILENANLPATEGNEMPRLPRWRASLLAVAHPTPRLDASLGVRHEGAQYNAIANDDGRNGGFGYADRYTFVDAKIGYRLTPQLRASVGVDNLFDSIRYLYHAYPGRTVLLTLKWRAQ